jgi:hypothetical protein
MATTEQAPTQSLEKTEVKTPEVITSADQFTAALANWSTRFNVLTPFAAISGIAAQHGIVRSVVQLDLRAQYASDPSREHGGDLYGGTPWLKGGPKGADDEQLAPSRKGLRKIADCAGISYTTLRVDPYTIQHFWMFKAVGSFRGVDGSVVTREATMEWDLRDGSERINGWKPDQVKEGRKNGLRNCESRAINALIRDCCGLKQSYTRNELKKPFLVVRVAFQPDMNDPDQRRMVAEAGLRSTSMLFGGAPALPAHAPVEDDDNEFQAARAGEPRHVGAGRAETAKPAEKPLPEGYGLIAKKPEEKAITKLTGGTFPKWIIVDHRGVQHVTKDKSFADSANRCFENKTPVEILSEENDHQELVITEINPLGAAAQQKLPDPNNL